LLIHPHVAASPGDEVSAGSCRLQSSPRIIGAAVIISVCAIVKLNGWCETYLSGQNGIAQQGGQCQQNWLKFTRCTELRDSDRVKKKAQSKGNGGLQYLGIR
jgi:hypothetical protein